MADYAEIITRRKSRDGFLSGLSTNNYAFAASSSDVMVASLSSIVSHMLCKVVFPQSYGFHSLGSAACIGLVVGLLYASFGRNANFYALPSFAAKRAQFDKVVAFTLCSLLLMTAILFLVRAGQDVSRVTFLIFAPTLTIALLLSRCCTRSLAQNLIGKGLLTGPAVVVVGDRDELEQVDQRSLLNQFGVQEVGRFILDDSEEFDERRTCRLLRMAQLSAAERFVVLVKWEADGQIAALRQALRRSALPATMLPDAGVRKLCDDRLGHSLDGSLPVIELQRAPLSSGTRFAKRTIDVVGSMTALAVLSPILLFTAIAIKLDSPGPVIFKQRRHGHDRRLFRIYKFRSMHVAEDGCRVTQASKDDPRVTRVGRAIRKTSIDELPQLFNVLAGDMSLVGPRPHAVAHDDEYGQLIMHYANRHHVKPGITGWAQVNGARGQTRVVEQMRRRVDLDLWYIDNCSIWLDIAILFRTCWEVVKSDAF